MIKMPEGKCTCELSTYIDNDYICRVTGTKCNCTPNGEPDRKACFLYSVTNKEDIFMEE